MFPAYESSSYYPPTSVSEYTNINTFSQPSETNVGRPEPSPPPSLLGQATGAQAALSFTSTWITPASTEELAAAGDDDDNSFLDTDFVYENGRRYHAPASGRVVYPLPNDESEQERDDMKHKLALWMMHEKLLYAPVDEVLKRGGMVFDLGMLLLLLSNSHLHSHLSMPYPSNLGGLRPVYSIMGSCLRVARLGCVVFPFSLLPLQITRLVHLPHNNGALYPWRAELNNMPLTWLFFFCLEKKKIILGVPQNRDRGLTYGVTKLQVPGQGSGPWRVSATIFCVSHPFSVSPTLPTCRDVVSRRTPTGAHRGRHDVPWGESGLWNTRGRQTWLCFPRTLLRSSSYRHASWPVSPPWSMRQHGVEFRYGTLAVYHRPKGAISLGCSRSWPPILKITAHVLRWFSIGGG